MILNIKYNLEKENKILLLSSKTAIFTVVDPISIPNLNLFIT